jgi:hypothetical protein
MSYHPIFASCILLEVIMFQGPVNPLSVADIHVSIRPWNPIRAKPEIQLDFARINFLLKLTISFDDVFVDPDRGGEKTDRPKFVPPVHLLDPGKTLANLSARIGFDLAHNGRHGILGGNHDHQMNMIDLDTQRLDFNVRVEPLDIE